MAVEAYAALISLTHVLDNVQHVHDLYLTTLDRNILESLRETLGYFQDFLENSGNSFKTEETAASHLESLIRDAAYDAEDIIETHITNEILVRAGKDALGEDYEEILSIDVGRGIKEVIDRMDAIKKELIILKTQEIQIKHNSQQPSESVSGTRGAFPAEDKDMMVLDEDVLIDILDRLTGQGSRRRIIPIFGMGGIGKTTLAKNIYANPVVVQRFDILAWVIISQEYCVRDILFSLAKQMKAVEDDETNMSEDKLGERVYKKLFGKRYLIVMDDIWSVEAWYKVKSFLPDNNSGSRIMITTRLSDVAGDLGSNCAVKMSLLDEVQSWKLFCRKVFGGEDCPIDELKRIGKKIVKSCRGLPLSISVVGGFLAKSDKSLNFWQGVAEAVISIVNSEDDDHCSRIMYLSYSHLPIHLKPCFLYLGVYPEDYEFQVDKLIKLWVAEGFLKPNKAKSLEEVAEECIGELASRNLILVHGREHIEGKIATFNIHDILRELSLRECQRENFIYIAGKSISVGKSTQHIRRFFIPAKGALKDKDSINQVQRSAPFVRSLTCYGFDDDLMVLLQTFRLQRVWNVIHGYTFQSFPRVCEAMNQLVNSRYLSFNIKSIEDHGAVPSMHLLWNLQTLIIFIYSLEGLTIPKEIWEMQQLRHLEINAYFLLPDPSTRRTSHQMEGRRDYFTVVENLQTLKNVRNFRYSEDIVKRIPNIRELSLQFSAESAEQLAALCPYDLSPLSKLETLYCDFSESRSVKYKMDLAFPSSLKMLALWGCNLSWEDMSLVGSLPNLQILRLCYSSPGQEWKPNEGEFLRLKFLLMMNLDLQFWTADNTHFPCLEHLFLWKMENLVDIPLGFAEIITLRSIALNYCNESTIMSAKRIQEERESLMGDDGFQLRLIRQ